ncbi:uncharacterized protein CBL_11542 [Carabus blaptoides fortunei]
MHQGAFLGGGWARGSTSTGVVRRAHPASGAQWNVQVVRGKVNGRCLWNACKALSLGLLLMVLGAAMATIGYYADHLSMAQEVRGNHTIRVKNESRGFHLNNLSYAGPIVMGVGGFIVVAACVMTFEARDSAAKVVPARFKLNAQAAPTPGSYPAHRTAGSQTAMSQLQRSQRHNTAPLHNRAALTQAFVQFSRGLASLEAKRKSVSSTASGKMVRSPSAPDLNMGRGTNLENCSPNLTSKGGVKPSPRTSRKTFAAGALLNPGLLHRHALSVDETAPPYRYSNESLGHASQEDAGSLAMDLHLPNDCPVTLRVRDRSRPRRPLCRQRPVVMDEESCTVSCADEPGNSSRSAHASPRMQTGAHSGTIAAGNIHQWLPPSSSSRRSSNASDCTHRARTRRRECPHSRGRLERAISSDSRLTGATARCHHHAAPLLTSHITPNISPSHSMLEDDSHQQNSCA